MSGPVWLAGSDQVNAPAIVTSWRSWSGLPNQRLARFSIVAPWATACSSTSSLATADQVLSEAANPAQLLQPTLQIVKTERVQRQRLRPDLSRALAPSAAR